MFLKRGLISEHGSSWLLPRLVGVSRALDLLWTSDRIDAAAACEIGLVDRVVEPDALIDSACDYVRQLAATSPPAAIAETKRLVYRHLGRFDRRSRFSTWLFRVAVNRSIQEARRHRHRWRNVELNEASASIAPEETDTTDPKVQATMARLAPSDRALLVLFYWEELNLQEIADSLGCNVNAAKTRLYRARERFRVLYEGEA